MTNPYALEYAHTEFAASSKAQFRAGLLNAINADFRLDAANIATDENLRNGIIRHGVWVNNRHIGYEAVVNQDGHLKITQFVPIKGRLSQPRALKTIDELRKEADDVRNCRKWLAGK